MAQLKSTQVHGDLNVTGEARVASNLVHHAGNQLDIGTTAAAARTAIGLGSVTNGATVNQTDAYLLARANQTGTQPVSTITGLGNAATHNYGTAANTVAMGSDSRINNGQAAYIWGNHASAGYIKSYVDTKYTAGSGMALVGNAFSTVYGTTTNTAVQGNDSRIVNAVTAYDWGNHATAGYIKSYVNTTYTGGTGLTLTGTTFSVNYGSVAGTAKAGNWVPSWDDVTGKPSTYAPSGHTHHWAQVTGQPATATRWPTFAEVSGKPLTDDEITKLKALLATVTVSGTAVTFSDTVNAKDVYIRG